MKLQHDPVLIRSKRKTISIEIGPRGMIVRAPIKMSDEAIADFLNRKHDWIQKTLMKTQTRQNKVSAMPLLTPLEIEELSEKAKVVILQKVEYYAKLLGVNYSRITIRCQRTRWGSCSSSGNLNFNCLLMLMPDEIVDSVVAHELCHRKHMNHSRAFYDELLRLFPNYKECRGWLKENGAVYLSRIP